MTTSTPTKAQELAILDQTIAKLGDASYLGPWLAEIRAEVARDLTSDFIPAYTLAHANAVARGIIEAAKADAAKIAEQGAIAAEANRRAILAAKVEAGRALHLVSQEVQRLATRVAATF